MRSPNRLRLTVKFIVLLDIWAWMVLEELYWSLTILQPEQLRREKIVMFYKFGKPERKKNLVSSNEQQEIQSKLIGYLDEAGLIFG